MKLTVLREVDIEVDAILIVIPLRYTDEEDSIAEDFPGRVGTTLTLTLDLASRSVRDWPVGRVESLHEKVVDEGCYYLISKGEVVESLEQEPVPACVPGDYGDYVVMEIDGEGKVKGWVTDANEIAIAFFNDED